MTASILSIDPRLPDLDAPQLDFSSGDAPEVFLDRLRTQNSALDQLRQALIVEEFSGPRDAAPLGRN